MLKLSDRERKQTKRKILASLLIIAITAAAAGCGNAGDGTGSGTAADGAGADSASSSGAMGRYVEEASDLSNKISGVGNAIFPLANGNFVVTDRMTDFVKTGDGAVWMADIRRWRTKMMEDGVYIMNMAVGADNTVALIYQADEENVSEEEETSVVLNPRLLIVKPDNTEIPVEISLTEDDKYLDKVFISDGGRIFVTTRGTSNIYEVMEDGSSELFLMVEEGHADLIQFQNNFMVMDGYGYEGLVIYDMENQEYIEDDVLTSFMKENYSGRSNNIDSYEVYFFFGEDDIIYLVGEKGLYRHVIGGSAMEQVIDGKLCSLGNPAYMLQGMIALEDKEFLALFEGGKVIRYVYNPDIATVPGSTLKVYGLEDNEIVRQAINLYQSKNPEVYIEFEYGMGRDNSVTREDALKSLNTKIVAGEGPDVLLLDDMPVDSYVEKGLLLELSPIIDSLSGEEALFENIVEAVKTDGKLYMVPCSVKLPVMLGDKSYISQADDLEGIADMIEAFDAQDPEQDLIGYCSEKSIMRLFSMTCVPAWTMENGEINQDVIREFLTQTERIYNAQMDGISDKEITRYLSIAEAYETNNGVLSYEDSDYVRQSGINKMNYIGGYYPLLFGIFDCLEINSIRKTEGFENTVWMPMGGQAGNVFWAKTLLGINAASKQAELAEDFLRTCLGKENQSYLYDSLAVNKAAFEESLDAEENGVDSNGRWGSVATEGEDGHPIVLVYYWPTEEEIAQYRKLMEEADTAYIEDSMLEEAVYEEGIDYLQGAQSLEEAVSEIERKVALYMAE